MSQDFVDSFWSLTVEDRPQDTVLDLSSYQGWTPSKSPAFTPSRTTEDRFIYSQGNQPKTPDFNPVGLFSPKPASPQRVPFGLDPPVTGDSIDAALADYEKQAGIRSHFYNRLEQTQFQEQDALIESNSLKCPLETLSKRLLTEKDADKATEYIDDANKAKVITCQNTFLAYTNGKYVRTHRLLGELVKIGQGVGGVAMKTIDENFIVKSSLSHNDSNELIHEYFVGAFGTNNLRSYIPNFTTVLGYFKCGGAFIQENGQAAYCLKDGGKESYILYEPVIGLSLDKWLKRNTNIDEVLQVLTGLILALDVAYRELEFTHYDLHAGNVIVKELDDPIAIPYQMEDKTLYLHTKYIPMIIDYGRSHIKYQDKSYGYFKVYELGVYPDRPYPMYDVFKILVYSVYYSQSNIPEMLDIVPIFNNQLDFNDIGVLANYISYDLIQDHWAILPYEDSYNMSPYDFFLQYWYLTYRQYIDKWLTETPMVGEVYGCSANGTCLPLPDLIDEMTTNGEDAIEDVFAFYDLYTLNSTVYYQDLGEPYAEDYYRQVLSKMIETVEEMNDVYSNMTKVTLENYLLRSDSYVNRYMNYIRTVGHLFGLTKTYDQYRKIVKLLNQLYPDVSGNFLDSIRQVESDYKSSSKLVNDEVKKLDKEIRTINQETIPDKLLDVIKSYTNVFYL